MGHHTDACMCELFACMFIQGPLNAVVLSVVPDARICHTTAHGLVLFDQEGAARAARTVHTVRQGMCVRLHP